MNDPSPILVTGSHRSGTTWTANMLSVAPRMGYVHEPFNVQFKLSTNPRPFKRNYQYICSENEGKYLDALHQILEFKYPFFFKLQSVRKFGELKKVLRDSRLSRLFRENHCRPLLKDPLAFFSAEWLHEIFGMDIVIMIRHPAAFYSSLKVKGWRYDFKGLAEQPLLLERYLSPFADQILEYAGQEPNLAEQASLLWNCIHHTVAVYQKEHPEWQFIRHEDLSRDPLHCFKGMYEQLGLDFTDEAERKIMASSGAHNPSERSRDEFIRNSKANISNWKTRLSAEETAHVRTQTEEMADRFYSQDDW